MAYQDTGKKVVYSMLFAMFFLFALLVALWAIGAIPTASYPQVLIERALPLVI